MFALFLGWVKTFGGWIAAGAAVVGSVFVIAEEEKSKGKLQQQTADSDAEATRMVNENAAATQTEVKAVENENVSQTDVAALPDGSALNELRADWQRPSVDSAGGSAKAGSD